MNRQLPKFKYHPDPIYTGVFEPLDEKCDCCGEVSHYVYTPAAYSTHGIDPLCPWCIASGKEKEKFDAEFTPNVAVTDNDIVEPWCDIPEDAEEEIVYRTPGFAGYQEEHWWSHCNDDAAFIGYAGDLNKGIFNGLKANNFVNEMKTAYELTDEEREWFISTPDKEHSITFYVFKCLHCGEIGGYGDFT